MTFNGFSEGEALKHGSRLIQLKLKSMRQVKGRITASNKTLFLRRGCCSQNGDFIVFVERETKSLIRFNPVDEQFSAFVMNLNLKNPFAVGRTKTANCFLVSDVGEVKILDENFRIVKTIQCSGLKWPHDLCLTDDEKFAFVSDFEGSVVYKIDLNAAKPVEKLAQYKPIDVKVSADRVFAISSCDFETECEKLIYINGSGNSIKVYDVDTCAELHCIAHAYLLEPQGLFVDDQNRVLYTVGQYVDQDTHLIDNDLSLFCFDLDTYGLLRIEPLVGLPRLEVTICDVFVWKDESKMNKKLFLSAFKNELFVFDLL